MARGRFEFPGWALSFPDVQTWRPGPFYSVAWGEKRFVKCLCLRCILISKLKLSHFVLYLQMVSHEWLAGESKCHFHFDLKNKKRLRAQTKWEGWFFSSVLFDCLLFQQGHVHGIKRSWGRGGQDAGDAEIHDIFRAAPSPHLRSLGRGTMKVGNNSRAKTELWLLLGWLSSLGQNGCHDISFFLTSNEG